MNKPKRTLTLDLFVIKKSKNVSITSFDLDLDQHGQAANDVSDISIANINQHFITDCANELISIVGSEHNQLSIHNNSYSSPDSTASNERSFLLSSTCCSIINHARIDVGVQTSTYNYSDCGKKTDSDCSTTKSKGFIGCEKLISNLLSLKKFSENIDVLLKMFKSTNNSKESCVRETYAFSDNTLKIINDLRLCCETYLLKYVNNRPVGPVSLQTCLESDLDAHAILPQFGSDELKYPIELDLFQPHLSTYPKFTKKSKNDNTHVESKPRKITSFQVKWYNNYPLIEYSVFKDRVYCFACRLFGDGSGTLRSDPAETKCRLQQWSKMAGKDGKLIKHFQSTAHVAVNER